MNDIPVLPMGFSAVPAGKVATVVTCLEMHARPAPRDLRAGSLRLERWKPSIEAYRSLFRRIGAEWMWVSRLVMPDAELEAILNDEKVEIFMLMDGERQAGLLELDFRLEGDCELAFFGLVADAIGQGAGRFLMEQAITKAWTAPIRRFWVHTCHLDHPAALSFYRRSGFVPYATLVEVMDDPRLSGVIAREAAPHVPLIDP